MDRHAHDYASWQCQPLSGSPTLTTGYNRLTINLDKPYERCTAVKNDDARTTLLVRTANISETLKRH